MVQIEQLSEIDAAAAAAAMERADADRTRVAPEIGSLHDEDAEADPARAREMERLQPWREQVTARGVVAAALIGFVLSVIVMKIALTTGLVPTLNISAALLAFLALRGWTRAPALLLPGGGAASSSSWRRPFTRQENTVVQTCAVACYTMGFGGARPATTSCLISLPKSFLICSCDGACI